MSPHWKAWRRNNLLGHHFIGVFTDVNFYFLWPNIIELFFGSRQNS